MPACKPPPLPPDTEELIIEVIRSRSPSPCARILQNASPVQGKYVYSFVANIFEFCYERKYQMEGNNNENYIIERRRVIATLLVV